MANNVPIYGELFPNTEERKAVDTQYVKNAEGKSVDELVQDNANKINALQDTVDDLPKNSSGGVLNNGTAEIVAIAEETYSTEDEEYFWQYKVYLGNFSNNSVKVSKGDCLFYTKADGTRVILRLDYNAGVDAVGPWFVRILDGKNALNSGSAAITATIVTPLYRVSGQFKCTTSHAGMTIHIGASFDGYTYVGAGGLELTEIVPSKAIVDFFSLTSVLPLKAVRASGAAYNDSTNLMYVVAAVRKYEFHLMALSGDAASPGIKYLVIDNSGSNMLTNIAGNASIQTVIPGVGIFEV